MRPMQISSRLRLVLVLFLIGYAANANAGAWTLARGSGYYNISSAMERSDTFANADGSHTDITTLGNYSLSVYGEYGLLDNLTLIGYLPFRRLVLNKQVGRPSGFVYFGVDDVTGIADAEIGLRGRLLHSGANVVSASITLGVPLGDHKHFNGLVTGDGEFNQRLVLQWGYSRHPAYLSADFGIDNHTDGFADEWLYAAEVGYSFQPALMLILRARGSESRKNGNDAITGGMGGLYANNKRYMTYGPELVYSMAGNMGLSLSALRSARTRNALVAPTFSLSFFYKH